MIVFNFTLQLTFYSFNSRKELHFALSLCIEFVTVCEILSVAPASIADMVMVPFLLRDTADTLTLYPIGHQSQISNIVIIDTKVELIRVTISSFQLDSIERLFVCGKQTVVPSPAGLIKSHFVKLI